MAKGKQKLTKEELETIDSIRNEASQIFFDLGRIAIRRRNVLNQIEDDEEKLENQHDDLVKKENDFYQTLQEKYGDGSIEPSTGEFIPSTAEEK
jgi:chaperonin cofactor prefoldin|tara:strand:- start:1198 stop:1479 length:282 start_codon:yes stop_codon:yes gene_type:complete